jgi:hypothetical protein
MYVDPNGINLRFLTTAENNITQIAYWIKRWETNALMIIIESLYGKENLYGNVTLHK